MAHFDDSLYHPPKFIKDIYEPEPEKEHQLESLGISPYTRIGSLINPSRKPKQSATGRSHAFTVVPPLKDRPLPVLESSADQRSVAALPFVAALGFLDYLRKARSAAQQDRWGLVFMPSFILLAAIGIMVYGAFFAVWPAASNPSSPNPFSNGQSLPGILDNNFSFLMSSKQFALSKPIAQSTPKKEVNKEAREVSSKPQLSQTTTSTPSSATPSIPVSNQPLTSSTTLPTTSSPSLSATTSPSTSTLTSPTTSVSSSGSQLLPVTSSSPMPSSTSTSPVTSAANSLTQPVTSPSSTSSTVTQLTAPLSSSTSSTPVQSPLTTTQSAIPSSSTNTNLGL